MTWRAGLYRALSRFVSRLFVDGCARMARCFLTGSLSFGLRHTHSVHVSAVCVTTVDQELPYAVFVLLFAFIVKEFR